MVRGWEAFRALRYRDFSLFWSSYFVSNVGSWMQAGFLAEWSSAPFALEAGAVVVALVAIFFLGPRLRRLHEV